MPLTFLDAVDFSRVPSMQFVVPVVASDPVPPFTPTYEAGLIYNSTSKEIKYFNGTVWVALGPAGAGGPPSGPASGDLSGSYPSPQIAAGVIVDADINAAAAIATSKISGLDTALAGKALATTDLTAGAGLTGGGTLAANRTFAVGAGTGITVNADDVAINRTTVDTWYVDVGGDTMTGDLILNRDPQVALGAATKQYVDLVSQGYTGKNAVRAVATTNITQSGTQTIDGVAVVVGNRVLCAGQTTPSQNGIWVVAASAWARAVDMDASGELVDGTYVPVAEGTTWGDSLFICTSITASPWVPGSSGSTWTRQSGLADLIAGNGLTKTGNQIDVVSANAAHMTVGTDSITIVSAPKWTTGQTITLTGDVTGVSAAWDGSAGISFVTAIGSGVIMDADINAGANIAQSKISGLGTSLSGKVDTTRSVLAGAGMTGGGTLAGDVTLNVISANADMTVAADAITINSAPKWTTARTLTLSGDVTGSVSFDGSGAINMTNTVVTSAGTAAKHFAGDVPAGTSCAITHSLGTRDVTVTVYRNSTPWDTVLCDVQRTDINTVTLKFAVAVTAAQFRAVVQGR